jgi:hypothetical protein
VVAGPSAPLMSGPLIDVKLPTNKGFRYYLQAGAQTFLRCYGLGGAGDLTTSVRSPLLSRCWLPPSSLASLGKY